MANPIQKSKLEADVEIQASAEQFYHMLVSYKLKHVQHTCSDKVQGCDLQQGEWGQVGSIINWSYVHDGKSKVAKEVIEAVEPDKNLITVRVLEGDLMEEFKSFLMTIQVSSKSGGSGAVVHFTMEYEKLHDGISHPESVLQLLVDLSKGMDAHLPQAN
ncbi:MLP-like protein 28 [Hibiscus syriacus]|uniref:MLP-like protein 28 n=1 Tax=Hibiscus syriacus TaxID=106335 RepID=UPI001922AABF|nr:MLP-like protein 28 [Hibiscus syriacus]